MFVQVILSRCLVCLSYLFIWLMSKFSLFYLLVRAVGDVATVCVVYSVNVSALKSLC